MLYLLRDDFMGEQHLAELRAGLGPAEFAELNTTVLDGPRLTLGELRAAAEALPFLGGRRLVVVRRLFDSAAGRAASGGDASSPRRANRAESEREQEFLDYLPLVPATTDLVFVEDSAFRGDHPAVRAIRSLHGEVHLDPPPRGEELTRWVGERVRAKGGRIDRAALDELTALSVDDLRQLDLTLDALIAYAGDRAIRREDVAELVPQSREADVFELVDAVGARDRRGALAAYRRLLAADESPVYLLVMLTRQFRLLLLTKEAQAGGEDVATALKVHPRVAQKLSQQARSYSVERCVAAYQRLVAVDQAIKTGQAEEEIAVELLVVELTER
jgi:DNA polymerase III subunit delta